MQITTKHLGEVQFEEANIITFSDGLPGFEEEKEYIIILSGDPELPFHYLQSIKNEDIAFIITNPFLFKENYDFELTDEVVEILKINDPSEISIYAITNIPDSVDKTSINLTAPIVINNTINQGMQIILKDYEFIKYFIFTSDGNEETSC